MSTNDPSSPSPGGQVLVYLTEDGLSRVECRFAGETLWLSLNEIATLFDRDKSVISKHLKNIFEDGELTEAATVAQYATVQREGAREVTRDIEYFNLEAIFAVGYRVRSPRGIQFRTWATARLKEYLIKGFTMDDERLKSPGSSVYFEHLLARIRDIRTSEKVFWRKVCDIYATSIDYDGKAETSQIFFAHVQNKMHWATHGHTAAEVIHRRADGSQPHMGLTHFAGSEPRRDEITVAKNYLSEHELETLNRLVNAYLHGSEVERLRHCPTFKSYLRVAGPTIRNFRMVRGMRSGGESISTIQIFRTVHAPPLTCKPGLQVEPVPSPTGTASVTSEAPTGRPHASPGQRPGSNGAQEFRALTGRDKGGQP